MEMQFLIKNGFTEVVLSGNVNMSSLITLTPQLNSHLNQYNNNHLVLNLSNTIYIDSSIIRLFLNVQKRLQESSKALYLLNPSQSIREILDTTNFNKAIPVIDSLAEFESECQSSKYLNYTFEENGMSRLMCSCEICGSKKVIGYFLDCSSIKWCWKDDDYFPVSINSEKQDFDFYSLLPVICTECYMCSVDLTHFNILDKTGAIALRSNIDSKTKQFLSRAISKRKRIIEPSGPGLSFLYPRDQLASYYAYLLVEDCLRTAAINKSCFNPFLIGAMRFINLRYCSEEEKEKIFKDCHLWLSQALRDNSYSSQGQLAKIYYMEMLSFLKTGDILYAKDIYKRFSDMILNCTSEANTVLLESPHFWFEKAQMVWKNEIMKNSRVMIN